MLVRLASKYEATILIGKDGELVDCKSILSLLTLGAAEGTKLSLTADGIDAAEAMQSIVELFELGFDEQDEIPGSKPSADTESVDSGPAST